MIDPTLRPLYQGSVDSILNAQQRAPLTDFFNSNPMQVEGANPLQQYAASMVPGLSQASPLQALALQQMMRMPSMAAAGPTTGYENQAAIPGISDYMSMLGMGQTQYAPSYAGSTPSMYNPSGPQPGAGGSGGYTPGQDHPDDPYGNHGTWTDPAGRQPTYAGGGGTDPTNENGGPPGQPPGRWNDPAWGQTYDVNPGTGGGDFGAGGGGSFGPYGPGGGGGDGRSGGQLAPHAAAYSGYGGGQPQMAQAPAQGGGSTAGAWRAQDFAGSAPTLNGMAMRTNFAETAPHASSNPYQAMAAAGMYADSATAQQNATPEQMTQWRNWVDQSQAYNDSPGQVQARLDAARAAGNNPILRPPGSGNMPQAAPGLSMTPQQMAAAARSAAGVGGGSAPAAPQAPQAPATQTPTALPAAYAGAGTLSEHSAQAATSPRTPPQTAPPPSMPPQGGAPPHQGSGGGFTGVPGTAPRQPVNALPPRPPPPTSSDGGSIGGNLPSRPPAPSMPPGGWPPPPPGSGGGQGGGAGWSGSGWTPGPPPGGFDVPPGLNESPWLGSRSSDMVGAVGPGNAELQRVSQQANQNGLIGGTAFGQSPGIQSAYQSVNGQPAINAGYQRVSGQQIQDDPAIAAAMQNFNLNVAPGIQNSAGNAGLGDSTAMTNAMARAQASMMTPLYQDAFAREQHTQDRGYGAVENDLSRQQHVQDRGYGATEEELARRERSSGRAADAQQSMIDRLLGLSGQRQGQQQQAIGTAMDVGGQLRGIGQDRNQASYQDFLRQQALGEQSAFVPFGQTVPSALGSRTMQTGK